MSYVAVVHRCPHCLNARDKFDHNVLLYSRDRLNNLKFPWFKNNASSTLLHNVSLKDQK